MSISMDVSPYFSGVGSLLPKDSARAEELVEELLSCIKRGHSIWIIGNGGSASTADHFEVDLSFVRNFEDKLIIKATSLCSNAALISAIGNDIGFENIFSHQLMRNAMPGDVCLAISASGNSPNLVKAFDYCTQESITKLAILGFDGGALLEMADSYLLITTENGLYGPVEDVHLSVCHFMAALIRDKLFQVKPA
jgi:D-sedoheptulose 7-phosphate isomerase